MDKEKLLTVLVKPGSGAGSVKKYKKIKIEIPQGVEDGMTLQLRGEGEPSDNGQPGDLLIRIHVKPHSVFERLSDGHILCNLDASFTDLALGVSLRSQLLKVTKN